MHNNSYLRVAQALFSLIEHESDPAKLADLAVLTYNLESVFDEHIAKGLGQELNLWIGLKKDRASFASDYGSGIKELYPELAVETQ